MKRQNQLQDYNTSHQIKSPVEISTIIEITDSVYTFCEVMNCIDPRKYLAVKEIKDKDYTLKEGSIIVTLTPEFTATLTAGEHTLGIVSVSGTAIASFTVMTDSVSDTVFDNSPVNDSEKSPQTGYTSNVLIWLYIHLPVLLL